MLFTPKIHRFIFLLGIAISLCALPYSIFALSVGLIVVAANWLLDGFWNEKLNRFLKRKSIWVFSLVYISVAISFFYSSNFGYGIKELRLWLPIFLVPIFLATSSPLTREEFKSLLILFCLSVFVATLISVGLFMKDFSLGSQNVRKISPYISHIRLALMVVFSIFILAYFAFKEEYFKPLYIRLLFLFAAFWMVVFLFILQSFTGIAILGIISFYLIIAQTISIRNTILKFSSIVIIVFALLLGITYLAHTIDGYYTRNYVDFKNLPKQTINRNPYIHDTLSRQYENGNLVWINVCIPELRREWNKVSRLPIDSLDKSGQLVKLTLIRYLSSKGLSKDSVGISHLDSIDIKLIENSVASVIYREHKAGVYPRLYQTLWEIDSYVNQGIIGGSSLVQRYVYLKASWYVIKNNFLFGVGIGDGVDSLNEYYKTSGVKLDKKYWYISHNQYLTVWIVSGILGLLLFLVGLLYPFFLEKKQKVFLCMVFQLLILASMLNEDTFETHTGISFAALFYAILFFGYDFMLDKSK